MNTENLKWIFSGISKMNFLLKANITNQGLRCCYCCCFFFFFFLFFRMVRRLRCSKKQIKDSVGLRSKWKLRMCNLKNLEIRTLHSHLLSFTKNICIFLLHFLIFCYKCLKTTEPHSLSLSIIPETPCNKLNNFLSGGNCSYIAYKHVYAKCYTSL